MFLYKSSYKNRYKNQLNKKEAVKMLVIDTTKKKVVGSFKVSDFRKNHSMIISSQMGITPSISFDYNNGGF